MNSVVIDIIQQSELLRRLFNNFTTNSTFNALILRQDGQADIPLEWLEHAFGIRLLRVERVVRALLDQDSNLVIVLGFR